MNKILILDYDKLLLQLLKNQRIVVITNSLDSIEEQFASSIQNNNVFAMFVSLPLTSISQIDFKPEWGAIPLIISAFNLGNYEHFLSKVDIIRSLNIRIYLSNKSETVFTELKIMASLGVDCGLWMNDGKRMDDDSFLDLASYYYMSPVPHATIEPFEHILNHLKEEINCGFEGVYFQDPTLFHRITTSEDITMLEKKADDGFPLKMAHYYKHFIDLDDCSKCPSFKICDKQMKSRLNDCTSTMNEIFEYAELRNNMKKNEPKTICQH